MDLRFAAADPALAPAADLIEAMVAEVSAVYGGERIDRPGKPSGTPADFSPPGGTFLVGWVGDEPVCGGGVKTLAPGLGEIKRMFVAPAWRGRGVAAALLVALEDASRSLGHTAVRLDTGPLQQGAQRLYERSGYRPIENYNANPDASFWGEKQL